MKSFFSIALLSALLFIILRPVSEDNLDINLKNKSKADIHSSKSKNVGKVLDHLDGVAIYFNGRMTNTSGRNTTPDGYNLGLRWQCVEFVKRYYFEKYQHKMPDSYGHAKDFFDVKLGTGWNRNRALNQYKNGAPRTPAKGDIIVFGPDDSNPYGHIGIISLVQAENIEIAQQNWGTTTRMNLSLIRRNGQNLIDHPEALGWLSLD